nr:MAG: polymerase PA [Xinjiang sediment orthomyxo-like virus 5]
MTSKNLLELFLDSNLTYPTEFVDWFGKRSPFWSRSTWGQREASLRHDMVCLLLCNLEPIKMNFEMPDYKTFFEPKPKRLRVEGTEVSSDTTSSEADSLTRDQDVVIDPTDVFQTKDIFYRYVLLEGKPDIGGLQKSISRMYNLPEMLRQYDIFDKEKKQFIEVKVTHDFRRSYEEYMSYMDPQEHTAFIHISPSSFAVTLVGRTEDLPGIGKAKQFLIGRLNIMHTQYNIMDTGLYDEEDICEETFGCKEFNEMVNLFTNSFWDKKDFREDQDLDTDSLKHPELVTSEDLFNCIEDTSIRNAEPMKFHGKLLPSVFTTHTETQLEKDSDILLELLVGFEFSDPVDRITDAVRIIIKDFLREKKVFQFVDKKSLRMNSYEDVRFALGIGAKKTTRFDDHPSLRQPEFPDKEKAKYVNWMSNLISDLSVVSDSDDVCFDYLAEAEMEHNHPISKITDNFCKDYFALFGRSKIAEYCSTVKNFYSRLGGAHLTRSSKGDASQISIFPIYSTCKRDDLVIRKVTGFVIKGLAHMKQPTDRVQLLICEMLGSGQRSIAYQRYIKKPIFVVDSIGRRWCIRQNAVMKHDMSYLKFITNSVYLCANMIGEICLNNPSVNVDTRMENLTNSFINGNEEWILQRITESVLMGVLGSSEEEGALAIIRKFFMINLAIRRNIISMVPDIKGLGEKLNECLISNPLSLYFAHQLKLSLVSPRP